MSYIQTTDTLELQVNYTGKIFGKNAKIINIMGRRTGFSTTTDFCDITNYLGTAVQNLTPVSTATQYYLYSLSSNDGDFVGSGVRTIEVVGLDASGNEKIQTFSMNGSNSVSIGTGWSAINYMEAVTVGSGGVAGGNITIASVTGAPNTNGGTTVCMINAGGNKSLSSSFKVPSNYIAYLIDWSISAQGGATQDARLRIDKNTKDNSLNSGVFHFFDKKFISSGSIFLSNRIFEKIPSNGTVKFSTIASSGTNTNTVEVNYRLLLIQN